MSDALFAAPVEPDHLPCTREGMPGTLHLADPVVWREERGVEESTPAAEITVLSARRVGHGQTFWLVGLGLAMAAMVAGLPVGFGLASLWLGLALKLVLDRVRPTVVIAIASASGPSELICHEWRALHAVMAFKATHDVQSGQESIDEVFSRALAQLRHAGEEARAYRILGVWTLFWYWGLPHLFWVVMWGIAITGSLQRGEPVGETFVILAMGPPITEALWPITAIPGGFLQVPFTPVLKWLIERPPTERKS